MSTKSEVCHGMGSFSRAMCLAVLALLAPCSRPALACSCAGNPPFLAVAHQAPLLVVGCVVGHSGHSRAGGPLQMDVQILQAWRGKAPGATLRIHGGDGWLCRPEVGMFPVGSEWLLAINAPGSKPGGDYALSSCGRYWLRIAGDKAEGAITREGGQESMSLTTLRAAINEGRARMTTGEVDVAAGEHYMLRFGDGFVFALEPSGGGWEIIVRQAKGEENLARLTPPLHFAPNPRMIEPEHLFASEALRAAGNFPGAGRDFIFSPEVGRTVVAPGATSAPTPEEVAAVARFGRGRLTILDAKGAVERIDSLRFRLELDWQAEQR